MTCLGLPYLKAVVVGEENAQDLYHDWARVREVAEDGAVLVRPDGYIAWRAPTATPEGGNQLADVRARVLGRPVCA